jgi:hypothetical protein
VESGDFQDHEDDPDGNEQKIWGDLLEIKKDLKQKERGEVEEDKNKHAQLHKDMKNSGRKRQRDSESEEDEEGNDEKADRRRYIKPRELLRLSPKRKYKPDEIEVRNYAIIQHNKTRYLVKIKSREGDVFQGHYLLSREPEKPLAERPYAMAWWDIKEELIRVGATNKKKKLEAMTVNFKAKDVYIVFSKMSGQKIPQEVLVEWEREYGKTTEMCNHMTYDDLFCRQGSGSYSQCTTTTASRTTANSGTPRTLENVSNIAASRPIHTYDAGRRRCE